MSKRLDRLALTDDAEETETAVVFRKCPKEEGGDVIALFPEIEEGRYLIGSYQHIGQHSAADYTKCIEATREATPEEYAPLFAELECIGYRLKVYRRGAHLLPWRR